MKATKPITITYHVAEGGDEYDVVDSCPALDMFAAVDRAEDWIDARIKSLGPTMRRFSRVANINWRAPERCYLSAVGGWSECYSYMATFAAV